MVAAEPHSFEAVTAVFSCTEQTFTAKGKTVLATGWKDLERRFMATLKQKAEPEDGDNAPVSDVPSFVEGQTFDRPKARVTEHDTTPPKSHNEASLLSAMERAGNEETDPINRAPAKSKDFVGKGGATKCNEYPSLDGCSETEFATTQRKGLGTPATRVAVIEKLVKGGFVERKGKQLLTIRTGNEMICVLPDVLTSPQLTADWENNLTQIAKGNADPDAFMGGIKAIARELVKTYSFLSDKEKEYFKEEKSTIGKCPLWLSRL